MVKANSKNRFNKLERSFLFYGILLLFVMAGFAGYSLLFLSRQLLHAFSTDETKIEQIKFDVEGYKQLNL